MPDRRSCAPGVTRTWLVLGGLGVVLLLLALLVADRLARSLTRPVTDLAGDRAPARQRRPDRPGDTGRPARRCARSATAVNRLAGRIGELLAAERESAADLAHRLRTPLTALRLDVEALPPADRERLLDDVDAVSRGIDEVISEARRPVREGLGAGCDATAVVGRPGALLVGAGRGGGPRGRRRPARGPAAGPRRRRRTSAPRWTPCSATSSPTPPRGRRSASPCGRGTAAAPRWPCPTPGPGCPPARGRARAQRRRVDRPRAGHRPPHRRGLRRRPPDRRRRAAGTDGHAGAGPRSGLADDPPAQDHPLRSLQRVEVGARVGVVDDDVGRRALLDARQPQPAAGRPRRRGQRRLGRAARPRAARAPRRR